MLVALGRQSRRSTHQLGPGMTWSGYTVEVMRNTTERLARYETAQEVIGMMIALRSAWIATELGKDVVRHDVVDAWREEQGRLTVERHQLLMDDDAGIDRVLREYAPIVKAAFAA